MKPKVINLLNKKINNILQVLTLKVKMEKVVIGINPKDKVLTVQKRMIVIMKVNMEVMNKVMKIIILRKEGVGELERGLFCDDRFLQPVHIYLQPDFLGGFSSEWWKPVQRAVDFVTVLRAKPLHGISGIKHGTNFESR